MYTTRCNKIQDSVRIFLIIQHKNMDYSKSKTDEHTLVNTSKTHHTFSIHMTIAYCTKNSSKIHR